MGPSVQDDEALLILTVSIRTVVLSGMISNSARPPTAVYRRCAALTLVQTARATRRHHPGTSTMAAFRFQDLWYIKVILSCYFI